MTSKKQRRNKAFRKKKLKNPDAQRQSTKIFKER